MDTWRFRCKIDGCVAQLSAFSTTDDHPRLTIWHVCGGHVHNTATAPDHAYPDVSMLPTDRKIPTFCGVARIGGVHK